MYKSSLTRRPVIRNTLGVPGSGVTIDATSERSMISEIDSPPRPISCATSSLNNEGWEREEFDKQNFIHFYCYI